MNIRSIRRKSTLTFSSFKIKKNSQITLVMVLDEVINYFAEYCTRTLGN